MRNVRPYGKRIFAFVPRLRPCSFPPGYEAECILLPEDVAGHDREGLMTIGGDDMSILQVEAALDGSVVPKVIALAAVLGLLLGGS